MSSTSKCILIIRAAVCNPKAFHVSYFLQHCYHNLSQNNQPQNGGIPKVLKITVTKFENDQDLPRADVLLDKVFMEFKIFLCLQL